MHSLLKIKKKHRLRNFNHYRTFEMPVSRMNKEGADEFDGKKAYQAQEEEGVPFVSVPDVLSPKAVD